MRWILGVALIVLAGCQTETVNQRVNNACRFAANVPEWDRCIAETHATIARERAREAAEEARRPRAVFCVPAFG